MTDYSTENSAPVDFYVELDIDKSASIEDIQQHLALQKERLSRQALSGNSRRSEAVREKLAHIREANKVFASEASRQAYDRSLSQRPEKPAKVDWVKRAWQSYYDNEIGTARIEAAHARADDDSDAEAYIVSAWIAQSLDNYEEALTYTDEALFRSPTTVEKSEIHEVRGAIYLGMERIRESLEESRQAIIDQPDEFIVLDINIRIVKTLMQLHDYDAVLAEAMTLLETTPRMPQSWQIELEAAIMATIDKACFDKYDFAHSAADYREWRTRITNSNLPHISRTAITTELDKQIRRTDLVVEALDTQGSLPKDDPSFAFWCIIFFPLWIVYFMRKQEIREGERRVAELDRQIKALDSEIDDDLLEYVNGRRPQ